MVQREIPIFSETMDVIDLPASLVAICRNFTEALQLCIRESRVKRTHQEWGELLGMAKGTFSQIINRNERTQRVRYLDGDRINQVQRLAGNRAISQWLDMDLHGQLNHQSAENRIRHLQAEIEKIKQEQLRRTA